MAKKYELMSNESLEMHQSNFLPILSNANLTTSTPVDLLELSNSYTYLILRALRSNEN